MYQAIVFLPLLGAILAGLITLVGAHARFPGGPPADTGHGHAPVPHAAAHEAADHAHAAHDEHAPAEPPRDGLVLRRADHDDLLFIAMVLSWIALWRVGFGHQDARDAIMPFIVSGDLKVDWAIRVDALTAVMLVVVTTVSALVHLYSIGYMAEDPYQPRFFAYLSMFTFAMLMLVTADNLVQLFFGWEGVGLASYLLIGFWYQKPSANAAAIKAFVVNRIGDFGFALGIFAVFMMTGAVDFDTIFAQAPALTGKTIHLIAWNFDAPTLICLLLFMGAMGKSAQFLLHTWLPGRHGGPDPGVGADPRRHHGDRRRLHGGAALAAVRALGDGADLRRHHRRDHGDVRRDRRRWSRTTSSASSPIRPARSSATCSSPWASAPIRSACIHLFTHAFFKALLFLGSGSVITAMHHEQDMRMMGGLRTKIPFTYVMMVVGTLALTGFPLTAGYFSKDAIIEAANASKNPAAFYGYLMTLVAAGLTAFYSWRLVLKTFHGRPHDEAHFEAAHESPRSMLIPLFVLACGSILAGLPFYQIFAGAGIENFFRDSLKLNTEVLEAMHHDSNVWISSLPTVAMAVGFGVAWLFYIRRPDIPVELARQQPVLYQFLLNKWYFDEIYDFLIVRPTLWLGRLLWKGGDGWLIDGFGPDGVSARVIDVTRNVVRLQTGYMYHYAFAMLIGVAAFITWFMFAAGGH